MTPFREAIQPWYDEDGLIGTCPNPGKWSGGNQLLDTGTAMVFLRLLNQMTTDDEQRFVNTLAKCEVKSGLYNKNPCRPDEITSDDIYGVVAGAKATTNTSKSLSEIYLYGLSNSWQYSNTDSDYFSSYAKPWDVTFYTLAANQTVAIWENAILAIIILINAFTKTDDMSGKKLTWLVIKTIQKNTALINLASIIWMWRIKKKYGSVKTIFERYYGIAHPFAVYCPE